MGGGNVLKLLMGRNVLMVCVGYHEICTLPLGDAL